MKLNPWLEEKLKGRINSKLKIIVEVDSKYFDEAVVALKRLGLPILLTSFNTFITVEAPIEMIDTIARLPFVKQIHYDMPVYIKPFPFLKIRDVLLGEVRVSEVEVPGIAPPTPVVPFGFPAPKLKRADVEIIPSSETKRVVVDVETALTGKGVKVAVIDTGATPTHPQLLFKKVKLHTTVPELPLDFQGHGQWCSTMALGKPSNTRFGRVEGIAVNADLIHVKALSTTGFGSTSGVIKAMEIAYLEGAKVVSMSLGSVQQGRVSNDPVCKTAAILRRAGVLVVAAAGNEGPGEWTVASPGVCIDVLTVGAYSVMYDDVADFSSRGPSGEWYKNHRSDWEEDYARYGDLLLKPDVLAPGGGPVNKRKPIDLIYSGTTGWFDGFYDFMADGYEAMRGTSMATPHVSGLMALLAEAVEDLTLDDVKRALRAREKDHVYGWGLISLKVFKS